MPLPCVAVWLSLLLRTGLAWPCSPALLVEMGALFIAQLQQYRLKDGEIWGLQLLVGILC